jgi:hypothetical protein
MQDKVTYERKATYIDIKMNGEFCGFPEVEAWPGNGNSRGYSGHRRRIPECFDQVTGLHPKPDIEPKSLLVLVVLKPVIPRSVF